MKFLSALCILCTVSYAAHAAQVASVKYIHDYITAKKGVTITPKETNTSKAANMKYLLCAVDKVNSALKCPTTSYCTNVRATTQAVDTIAVEDAMTRLAKTGAAAYQVIDYVTFTGKQYVDTGQVPLRNTLRIELDFKLDALDNQLAVIGGRDVTYNGIIFWPYLSNCLDASFDYYGASTGVDRICGGMGTPNLAWHTLKIDGAKLYIDNMTMPKVTATSANSNAIDYTLFVGGTNNKGSLAHGFVGKVKGVKIYKSNVLVVDMVPVKRISDDEYGYFDQVSKTFKGNGGAEPLTGATTVTGYLTAAGTAACQ